MSICLKDTVSLGVTASDIKSRGTRGRYDSELAFRADTWMQFGNKTQFDTQRTSHFFLQLAALIILRLLSTPPPITNDSLLSGRKSRPCWNYLMVLTEDHISFCRLLFRKQLNLTLGRLSMPHPLAHHWTAWKSEGGAKR